MGDSPQSFREQVRVALSFRAKARDKAPGSPLPRVAENGLATVRDRIRQRLAVLGRELARLHARRKDLVKAAAAGKLTPTQANERNRAIEKESAALREEQSALQDLLTADEPAKAGGFLDMPLDQYPVPKAGSGRVSWKRILLLVLVGAVIAAPLVFRFVRASVSQHIVVSAELAAPGTGEVLVTVENMTTAPVAFHAPWPRGEPRPLDGERRAIAAGVVLRVRFEGEPEFRLLPDSETAWRSAGFGVAGGYSHHIEPGGMLVLALDLSSVAQMVGRPEAVRLVFSMERGREIARYDFDVPARFADRGRAAPVMQRPGAGTLHRHAPELPREIAPDERDTVPAQRPTGPTVRFSGRVGEEAAVIVVREGETPVRHFVGEGDMLLEPWQVERIDTAGNMLVLVDRRTDRRLQVRRGQEVTLPAS